MPQIISILIVLIGFIILGIGIRWWWKTSWRPLLKSSKVGDIQREEEEEEEEENNTESSL